MVFLMAMLLAPAASPPPPKVTARARATIMVLQPYKASDKSWNPLIHRNQREIILRLADNDEVRVRLTEFE
jgi:hypothetical protein